MSDITIYVADSIELATFLFATENWLATFFNTLQSIWLILIWK